MDSVVAKFYSTGNGDTSRFTNFGSLTTAKFGASNGINKTSSYKAPMVPVPTSTLKPANINLNAFNNTIPKNSLPKYNNIQLQAAPSLKRVVFNSTSDMIHPNQLPNYRGELYNMKQKTLEDEKRNATKLQIMEEKMRNLELKSQRLEVINDFFFDMFENNLVKEQLQKQREDKAMKELGEEEEEEDYDDYNNNYYNNYNNMPKKMQRKNRIKAMSANHRGKNLNLNNYDYRPPEFDPEEFQEKTLDNARKVLKGIKESIGNYMLEEQLKKNEELQTITEGIVEMKNELQSRIERIAQRQKNQMETLAFCLQNSGNPQIEEVANRILSNDYYNYQLNSPIFGSPNSNENGSTSSKRNPLNRSNHTGPRMSMIGNALNFKKMSNTIKEEDEKSSSSSSSSNTKSNANTNINVKLAQSGKRSSISQSKKSPGRRVSIKNGF